MPNNKFMAKLHGEKAIKSVLEIKKYGDDRPFANMPNGSSEANIGTDTQINHGISYVRGTQVWKIDGSSMSVADNDYTGSGADKTGEVEVSGQGLWVDATYVFPNNLTEDTLAAVISAYPKFVVNLFGDNLFNGSNTQIDLTVLLKLGNTNLVAKTFSIMPQANFFHKQLEIGFDESIDDDTYFEQGARLTLQVICSDPTATARIYTGMSNLVLLNRKIDTNLVTPDFQDFDEWVYRIEDMETKIDKVIVKSETIPDASTVDIGSVYMYMGETNPTYTHGYIYQNITSTEDVMTFSDDSISCDWTALSAFLARHTEDYNSIVKGTMEYIVEANLWKITFKNANDGEVFHYQQYTSDWEEIGFVFGREFTTDTIVTFTRNTTETPQWERMDVQPAGQDAIWGNITGTLANQTDLQNALNAKQDTLTQGTGITISNNTISANAATNTSAGIAKLYTSTGANTDGSMDQNSITSALAELNEVEVSTTEPTDPSVEVWINPDGEGFDPNTKQDKLSAGYGINIQKNEITLPAGYTQLEYVESDGTQFVDTGVIYNSGDNVEIKYQFLEYKPQNYSGYVFGVHMQTISSTSTNSQCFLRVSPSIQNVLSVAGCVSSDVTAGSNDTHIHSYRIEVNKPFFDGKEITQGGVVAFNNPAPYATGATMALFGVKRNNFPTPDVYEELSSPIPTRIYEFEIEGKCHLLPAKNPDGTVGFYDTVRKQFITTKSGNALVAGKEIFGSVISCTVTGSGNPMTGVEITDGFVLPEEFQAVEYIQNTGKEVIQVPSDYILKSDSFTLEFDFRDVGSATFAGPLIGTINSANEFYRIDRGASTGRFTLTENGNGGGAIGISGTFVDYAHGGFPEFNNLPTRRIDQGSNVDGYWDFVNVIGNRYISFNAKNIGSFGLFGLINHSGGTISYTPSIATYRIYRYIQRDLYGNTKVFMIPVKRISDNVVGMYDFVSGQFCTSANQEQNTLFAGPNKDYHNGVSAGSAIYYDKNFTTSISGGKVLVRVDVENGLVLSKRETYSDVTNTLYEKSCSTGTGGQAHQKSYQTVIGYGALGGNEGATAYGSDAKAISYFSTAIGRLSSASNSYAIAIGTSTNVNGGEAVGLGHNASATGNSGVAVGANAKANAIYSTGVGPGSEATGTYSTSVGFQSKATSSGAVAVGQNAQAGSSNGVSVGQYAIVSANCADSIQLGTGTNSAAGKLQVWSWELLDKTTGKIPAARIDMPESASALSDLTDVSLSSLTNGQSLVYNNGVWSNAKAGVEVTYDTTHKRLKFA